MLKRAMGVDMGFRCTGLTLFELELERDVLKEARAVCPKVSKQSSTVLRDVEDCFSLLDGIRTAIQDWKPQGIFVELPHGGAQSSRAARCMGMATALIIPILQYEDLGFELYAPGEVEMALGIKLTRDEAKRLGLNKGESTKWKKARVRAIVDKEWPDFKGWPEKAGVAEDSYDSAAAFLCGRAKSRMYARLRHA